jgi:protein TonB
MTRAAKSTVWLFPEGTLFPIVSGELHPLKRFSRRLLYRGMIVGILLHVLTFGGWLAARIFKPEPPPAAVVLQVRTVKSAAELGVPPSISQNTDAVSAVAIAAAQAVTYGVPEPVPDFQATTSTVATSEQIAESLAPVDISDLGSSADSLVIDESLFAGQNASPDGVQVFDELPVPIDTPSPVYPDLAQSGQVEGTVTVKLLVTKDGTVGDVVVVEGNWLLHDAAIAAVKTWTFKPALHQHKPVQVWVEIPINFALN